MTRRFLAATSNKRCVCLNILPTTLLAISTDGDAASGPSSSCNIKCPGDAGESCFRTSCCGGPEQAYSIYATGGERCVIQLKITPRRSRRVVKKISATLKKVVQEWRYQFSLYRKEWRYQYHHCCHRFLLLGNFRRTKTFRSMDQDSLRQCANILVLVNIRKKHPSIASVFVIWSILWSIKHGSANNFLVFTPRPSLSVVSAILYNVWYFTENLILAL